MIGLLNSCCGFVSATALLQVAGSASMFGWLLLLPSAEFPGTQEPATVAVLVETVPQLEAGPIGLPLICAPQCSTLPRSSFPVVSPENSGQLQEMMALRARVGTGLGSAEDFQVALAALIQEDQETRSTWPATSPDTLPNRIPSVSNQPPQPPICVDAVPLNSCVNSCVNQPLQGSTASAAPIWVQRQSENLVQQWMPPHGLPPHGQPPSTLPPHMQQQHMQPPHMQPPHEQPQHWLRPYLQPNHGQPNHGQLLQPQPPNFQPPNHRHDNHRPDNGPVPNSRPDAQPEQSHRIRHAARMLEESAWELEEAGEYSLADDVRRQASELYHRARGQSRVR
ncbi:MAG: hypothetical protein Q8M16_21760 [Pirellulaceae bacterium]|nr:hypothetical protein [Pirellulaceae bacterium]